MTDDTPISRRTVLRGAAGTAVIAAGAGGLAWITGPTTATQINISDTQVATDDGDLSVLDLLLNDYYAIWDGFDKRVAAVAFRDRVRHVASDQVHELFDQRGDDADPVLLTEISSQGNGGDGWGGPGEFASTFDSKTEPDTSVVQRPGVDGPDTAFAGWVHADVLWRLASDTPGDSGHSIEDPALLGDALPAMDNPDDGTTDWHTIQLIKEVYLYRLPEGDESADLQTQNGTGVVLMGGDDGTAPKIQATPRFRVGVINEPDEEEPQGEGEAQAG